MSLEIEPIGKEFTDSLMTIVNRAINAIRHPSEPSIRDDSQEYRRTDQRLNEWLG